jgi:hypothetical protein
MPRPPRGTPMTEDAGAADARRELEKWIEQEEERQGK